MFGTHCPKGMEAGAHLRPHCTLLCLCWSSVMCFAMLAVSLLMHGLCHVKGLSCLSHAMLGVSGNLTLSCFSFVTLWFCPLSCFSCITLYL